MANYGKLKTMKAAAIGTIIPWVGGTTDLPKGWLICDGTSISASKYPLLAQIIGNTYGGSTFSGNFPNYSGNITLPKIISRPLVDMDVAHFGAGALGTKRQNIDTAEAADIVAKYIGTGVGSTGGTTTVITVNGSTFVVTPSSGIPLTNNDVAPLSMVGTSSTRAQRTGAQNKNPSLSWSFNTNQFPPGVNISSFTLLLEDLSETINGTNLTLWYLTNIPANTNFISADATTLPVGTSVRPNYLGSIGTSGVSAVGYSGPQPPIGESHTYRLTISAILAGATSSVLTQSLQFKYPAPSLNDVPIENLSNPRFQTNKTIVIGNIGSLVAASDIDNSITTNWEAPTDILFEYAIDSEFSGTITGARIDGGVGTKSLYTAPRKLGRKHLQPHTHAGSVVSISGVEEPKPGRGVSCSREIEYKFSSPRWDEWADKLLGIVFDGPDTSANYGSIPSANSTAVGTGISPVILANISTEASVLKPYGTTSHPIAYWFGNDTQFSRPYGTPSNPLFQQKELEVKDDVPFGLYGRVYLENTNYDPGLPTSGDEHRPYKVSFNNSAINFTTNSNLGQSVTVIEGHDHGQFDIDYTNGTLRMPSSIVTNNVIADIEPNNLPGALNINVAVTSPNLLVMYLIRAY
jgi:hypothetical protein